MKNIMMVIGAALFFFLLVILSLLLITFPYLLGGALAYVIHEYLLINIINNVIARGIISGCIGLTFSLLICLLITKINSNKEAKN